METFCGHLVLPLKNERHTEQAVGGSNANQIVPKLIEVKKQDREGHHKDDESS